MDPRLILEVNLVHPVAILIHRQAAEDSPDRLEHWVSPIYNNGQHKSGLNWLLFKPFRCGYV